MSRSGRLRPRAMTPPKSNGEAGGVAGQVFGARETAEEAGCEEAIIWV